MDGVVICDVVAVVAQRRGEEWHQPYRADPQFLKVIELLFKSLKITDTIPVAVVESADVHLIDDRVLVPKRILIEWQTTFSEQFRYLPAEQGNMQVYMKQQPSNFMAPNARSKNTLGGEAQVARRGRSVSAWHSHSGRRSVVVGSGALPLATSGNDGLPCAAHQRPNPHAALCSQGMAVRSHGGARIRSDIL